MIETHVFKPYQNGQKQKKLFFSAPERARTVLNAFLDVCIWPWFIYTTLLIQTDVAYTDVAYTDGRRLYGPRLYRRPLYGRFRNIRCFNRNLR